MAYSTIFRANKVINNSTAETDLRKRLIAEAKVLRAYNYFDLVSLWGDVPLVTGDIPASEWTTTPRAKKADMYAQIQKDLQEAIAVFPIKPDIVVQTASVYQKVQHRRFLAKLTIPAKMG